MTIYAELKELVVENNLKEVDELLMDMYTVERYKLVINALREDDFLVLERLLIWEETYLSDLSTFFETALKQPLSLEMASILISHAIRHPRPTRGYDSILSFVQQRDRELADYLETTARTLRETELSLRARLALLKQDNPIYFLVSKLHKELISVKLGDAENIIRAVGAFCYLEQKLTEIYLLMQQFPLSATETKSLINETSIILTQWSVNPFYCGHTPNLIARLEDLCISLEISPLKGMLEYFLKIQQEATRSQDWLIKPTAAIKEDPTFPLECPIGQCSGYSFMLAQSMWADDFITFSTRLDLLTETPVEQLKDTLDKNREQILLSQEQAKREGKQVQLLAEQQNYIDLETFLLDMGIAQGYWIHPGLGEYTHDFLSVAPIVMSKKIEDEGGIVQIRKFTFYYDHTSVQVYFNTLRNLIAASKEIPPYVVIRLACRDHTFIVAYDVRARKWIAGDPNSPYKKPQYVNSDWMLATIVMSGMHFGHADPTIREIETQVLATKRQEASISALFNSWDTLPHVKEIHNSQRKQALSDRKPVYSKVEGSLKFALASGDIELMRLSANPSQLNVPRADGYRPITWSVMRSHPVAVKFLVDSNVDVNVQVTPFDTFCAPLLQSLFHESEEIFGLLLLSPTLVVTAEIISLWLIYIRANKKTGHFKALLKSANPNLHKEFIRNSSMFDVVLELLPSDTSLVAFLSCEEVKRHLRYWVMDGSILEKMLAHIPIEQRYSFLASNQDLLFYNVRAELADSSPIAQIVNYLPEDHISLLLELEIIIKTLQAPLDLYALLMTNRISGELLASFIQDKIGDEALTNFIQQYGVHAITSKLPVDKATLFLQRKSVQDCLAARTAVNSSGASIFKMPLGQIDVVIEHVDCDRFQGMAEIPLLCMIIKSLPLEKVGNFIRENIRITKEHDTELIVHLIQELNDTHQDKLVESIAEKPELLEMISKSECVDELLYGTILIDEEIFFENLIRIIHRQTRSGALAVKKIHELYSDHPWLCEQLVEANKNMTKRQNDKPVVSTHRDSLFKHTSDIPATQSAKRARHEVGTDSFECVN